MLRSLIVLLAQFLFTFPLFAGLVGEIHIRGVRISSELTVLDTEPLAIAVSDTEDQKNPLVASNGAHFLLGWTSSNRQARSRAVRAR